PPGDDAAEDHVVASGGACQENRPGALEEGVGSQPVPACQAGQRVRRGGRQRCPFDAGGAAAARRARLAGGACLAWAGLAPPVEGQRRFLAQAGELAPPETLATGGTLALEPGDVVAERARRRQLRRPSREPGGVVSAHLGQ